MKMKTFTKAAGIRLLIFAMAAAIVCVIGCCSMISMPGKTWIDPLPPPSGGQILLASELESDVMHLSCDIGERNLVAYPGLEKAKEWITESFEKAGYSVSSQEYRAKPETISLWLTQLRYPNKKQTEKEAQSYFNLTAEKKGSERPDEIIIIGAHYDSVPLDGCKGANDNASGVAGLIALARHFKDVETSRTFRFCAFTNEEPPFFQTDSMGSYIYASECRKKDENIIAVLCLDEIGFFPSEPNTQNYPFPLNYLYPSTGNFIAFVGCTKYSYLVKKCIGTFRDNAKFPSEGAAIPGIIPGVGWSDHWSFWKMGYPALMITDTAPYRYPFYHTSSDNPDKIDFIKMAAVVEGIKSVISGIDTAP